MLKSNGDGDDVGDGDADDGVQLLGKNENAIKNMPLAEREIESRQ